MTLVAVEQHQEPYGQQYGVQSRRGHHRGGADVQFNAPSQDLSTSVESDHDDSMASILSDIGDFFLVETSRDIGYEDVQDGDKSAEDGKVYSGRLGEPGTGMKRLPVYSSAVIVPNRNDTSSQANSANPVTTLNGGVKSNSFDSSSNEESNRNKDKELAKQTNSDDNNSVAKAMITPRMKTQFHKSNEPDKVVVTPRPLTTQEPSGVGVETAQQIMRRNEQFLWNEKRNIA
ncbi:unnamed protein product [Anisakis simplex]|uniref:SIT4 phosphatase-associated family protein n=1 Tax=Anisakis simplex TaxID=6269 RepID=A0A0M3K1L8_ANISI|nr:unnamed protein product [Anisakis simplex]